MFELPTGVVTFLFTDVEGSTRLWQDAPEVMAQALRTHDRVIEEAALVNNGVHIGARGEGDSHFVVFPVAADALTAAAMIQRQLAEISWETPRPIKVRASIHTGAVDMQLGQYYGTPVNRAARLRGIAHGGQTLISASTWELTKDSLPHGVAVVDRGEHRLRDLTSPEHVFELVIDGLQKDFPPLLSLDAARNNLPVQLTDFIGRPEVADIKRLIGDTRLVTILAPGGVGKTRAAIQAAAESMADFPDGVFFIDLAPIDSPRDIAQTASESIGIALAGDDDLETQLLRHLTNERQLLIFDNFEHVVEGANLIARILTAAPGVKVLMTSRVKLGISGETICNLPGLTIDWETPEDAFEASGVRLFIDAAKRADARFSLGVDDLEHLSRILRLVGGTPLGIILAASWVDTLRVDEIANEVEKNMDFLEADQMDHPDRHRSMRAVFDYSWGLLNDEERLSFAGLAVFRDGFTREAAEAVTGASLRNLSNLVSKSLISFDRDSNRYAVHELLRQYAEAELAADRSTHAMRLAKHSDYFATLATVTAEKIFTGGDQGAQTISLVVQDIDNMRAALRHACQTGDAESAGAFTLTFGWIYEMNGWIKAGSEVFAEVRESFEGMDTESAIVTTALATTDEAKFLTNLGQLDSAVPMAAAAVDILKSRDNAVSYIIALEALCEIMAYRGDVERVLELSTEAKRIADEQGFVSMSAAFAGYIASGALEAGDLESALETLREGERILLGAGGHAFLGWNLLYQATIAVTQGRFDDAYSLYLRQLEVSRTFGYRRVIASGLMGIGQVHATKGEWELADRSLREGLEEFERIGLIADMSYAALLAARVRPILGDIELAVAVASSIEADPASQQAYFFESETTAALAAEFLEELSATTEPGVFASAVAQGQAKGLDVMIKELLNEERL